MAIPDIVTWAESAAGFYLPTKKPIVLAPHQRDILRHVFTAGPDGRLPYETIVYSCPKKSGKTTIAALVGLYFALFFEPPNEIYTVANDLEQNLGRVYADVGSAIRLNPILARRSQVQARIATLDNGTVITPLASEYAGAAGSRHGLTLWDELWGYTTESSRRLWDELTPIPTRLNSIRFIVTYAGFEGESNLLEGLYKQGQAGDVVAELAHIEDGRGQPACRASGRTFVYWDHELKPHPGLAISPDEYHEQQRKDLRPAAYIRLHENEWVSSISQFVEPEQWAACFDPEIVPLVPGDGRRVVFGADASTSRDFTALVGVERGRDKITRVVYVKVWRPKKSHLRGGKATIDLSETIEAEIKQLYAAGVVAKVGYDPYQLHSIGMNLSKLGVPMQEIPQTNARIAADQGLYDAIIGRTLRHYNHPDLNQAIANAVAIETARGWRLAKEKTSRKIDAAVSLSMAKYLAADVHETDWESVKGLGRVENFTSRWDMGATVDSGGPVYGRWS